MVVRQPKIVGGGGGHWALRMIWHQQKQKGTCSQKHWRRKRGGARGHVPPLSDPEFRDVPPILSRSYAVEKGHFFQDYRGADAPLPPPPPARYGPASITCRPYVLTKRTCHTIPLGTAVDQKTDFLIINTGRLHHVTALAWYDLGCCWGDKPVTPINSLI